MSGGLALLNLSIHVMDIGLSYAPAVVIATSGILPGFGKSLISKTKYAQAQALIRRQQFGCGAGEVPNDEAKPIHFILVVPLTILLIVAAYYALNWVGNAQIPALNIAIGLLLFSLGLFIRKQFLSDWEGSPRKLDFACLLIGMFFYF